MADEAQPGQLQAMIVPVTPFQQNCAIIWDSASGEGAVFDPGGDVDAILDAIGQSGARITAIYLTHGHIDHAGGADELRDRLNASAREEGRAAIEVIGPHEADRGLLENIGRQAQMFGVGGGMRDAHPDRFLNEGDVVRIGAHEFLVLHCPGHSPGHVVYFHEKARFAHVGDVLFSGSVGRTDLPGGDHYALIASIKEKLLPLGDDVAFLCGHGPGSNFGEERRNNPFLR
jgi:hydroxyacylglutathione hydrolase